MARLCHWYCDVIVSVPVAYGSFVFHQEWIVCVLRVHLVSYVEGATFTQNTVDNNLHVIFVWFFFDRHQFCLRVVYILKTVLMFKRLTHPQWPHLSKGRVVSLASLGHLGIHYVS